MRIGPHHPVADHTHVCVGFSPLLLHRGYVLVDTYHTISFQATGVAGVTIEVDMNVLVKFGDSR